ncbi:nucleotide pyrophosphohydrolase [Aquisalibacillus elongatus]|uniref:NTP pyrophosphatase (Non-canonical NTP hydrolase) n=1 Tax=Aquisalibacillus elongatus TaxID=485577 RepID=A0A3N5BEA0_9BACI|nr:nucleotide pyrophosphohydrolase [Aquisalibacillus elongatus]RPF55783.1 NTP pyrophosphatase (non-canonical NTP hydrolase) [Aquisalibacillus elongatus]
MENSKQDLKLMQKRVDNFISQFEEGYFSPLAMIARLTEELGELSREVNHYYGEKPKKDSEKEKLVEEELGDFLFVMMTFANSLDIDLSEAFDRSMSKIETRDQNRWTPKDKENES